MNIHETIIIDLLLTCWYHTDWLAVFRIERKWPSRREAAVSKRWEIHKYQKYNRVKYSWDTKKYQTRFHCLYSYWNAMRNKNLVIKIIHKIIWIGFFTSIFISPNYGVCETAIQASQQCNDLRGRQCSIIVLLIDFMVTICTHGFNVEKEAAVNKKYIRVEEFRLKLIDSNLSKTVSVTETISNRINPIVKQRAFKNTAFRTHAITFVVPSILFFTRLRPRDAPFRSWCNSRFVAVFKHTRNSVGTP